MRMRNDQPCLFGLKDAGMSASFSPCRNYRYELWRRWGAEPASDYVAFIGLNPSTADEANDDRTVSRCINFAKAWGFQAMVMLNLYAYRATDPEEMKVQSDPMGPLNLDTVVRVSRQAKLRIAAWGTNAKELHAESLCDAIGLPIHCLRKTKRGFPGHPLYIPASTTPIRFY